MEAISLRSYWHACIVAYFVCIRRIRSSSAELELGKGLKTMLWYGFPLYIAIVVNRFLSRFLGILMGIYSSDALIGNYQVSLNFSVLIAFFSIPVATVLFLTFSKLDYKKTSRP